jgi:hypothetical protein
MCSWGAGYNSRYNGRLHDYILYTKRILAASYAWVQSGHTTGLERLGFYGDARAALRAGPRAALHAGPRAALRAGLRAALRAGPRAALRAGLRAALPAGLQAAQLSDQPQRHRAAGPSGQWTNCTDTYQWTLRPCSPGARSRSHEQPLARCWDRTQTLPTGVYTPLDRANQTALTACTCLDPQPLARPAQEEWHGPIRDGSGSRRGDYT